MLRTSPFPRAFAMVALAFLLAAVLPRTAAAASAMPTDASVIFMHHSTGAVIWGGGVAGWFDDYNAAHGTHYAVSHEIYPFDPYVPHNGNYPYDYWNLWVNHAGPTPYLDNPTLEILTTQYNVIVFKHCFPVGSITPDTGMPDITSNDQTLENYKLQYDALKTKLHQFPNNRFIVWTGAAHLERETTPDMAQRHRQFVDWVMNTWDQPGDNIYVWDFYDLETDGGIYMNPAYSNYDSHPSDAFGATVAPLFAQRIVDVIRGVGDSTGITSAPGPAREPLSFALAGPNPCAGPVRFSVGLPGASPVALSVYDTAGRLVGRVDRGLAPAGASALAWDGRATGVGAGVYFARLATEHGTLTRRFLLIP